MWRTLGISRDLSCHFFRNIRLGYNLSPSYLKYSFRDIWVPMIPLFSFLACVNYATGMDGTAAVLTALAYTYVYFLLFMLLAVYYMRYHEVEPPEIPYYYGLDPFQQSVTTNPDGDFLMLDLES